MGKFEKEFVYNNNPYLPFLKCWYRYINDNFFIFSGTMAQLVEFVSYLNAKMSTIKFSLEYDLESINFVDVEVCTRNQLSTTIFREETRCEELFTFFQFSSTGSQEGQGESAVLMNLLIYFLRNCAIDSWLKVITKGFLTITNLRLKKVIGGHC